MAASEDELTLAQVMLPEDANPHGNVHGGTLMKLADTAGGTCATRHARRPMGTAGIESKNLQQPGYVGKLLLLPPGGAWGGRKRGEDQGINYSQGGLDCGGRG